MSIESPLMMLSSTSRFFASVSAFLSVSCERTDCSFDKAARLVSRSFSRPSISAKRDLMTSDTELSAFASAFSSWLRRAACTGGVGKGTAGSFILSYSPFAAVADAPEAIVALDKAACRGTSGWSSDGTDPDGLEKRDPPSNGFLPVDRDLSISIAQ